MEQTGEVTRLPLSSITVDRRVQARVVLDINVIGIYADALTRGDEFSPIMVYFDGQTYWLAEGFHHYYAAQAANRRNIKVTIRPGGLREAIWNTACVTSDQRLDAAFENGGLGSLVDNVDRIHATLSNERAR